MKIVFLWFVSLMVFACENIYTYDSNHQLDVCTIKNDAHLLEDDLETDEQFFARINPEYKAIIVEYRSVMDFFGIDIRGRVNNDSQQIDDASEEVLLEFAHYIGNRNISYDDYLSRLHLKKFVLESHVKEYRQRFDAKKFNIGHMVDHHSILSGLYKKEKLLAEVKLFLQYLEYHRAYFVSDILND